MKYLLLLLLLLGAPITADKSGVRAAIKKVHLVQSNHLDVGFTGGITTVLNEYFDSFLPDAVNTSMHLRERGGEEQLVFTTHAFVVSLFLDCPAGRGLHCPTPTAKAYIEGAIRDGVISLHAFPFNAELGMYDASLIEAGVELAGSLHARYGRPRPTVLSQRDVPGMTQAVVTVLRKLGVEAVSIGVNNAAQPPGVPPIFRWQAPAGGASVIGMVHPGGYAEIDIDRLEGGGCDDPPCTRHAHEYYTVPGCDEALVNAWNSDNLGPPTRADVLLTFNATRKLFPNAAIVASTMDAFVTAVQPHAANLPLVTGEIADNWIYGTGSDPWKVAALRAAARSRSAYLANATQHAAVPGGSAEDPRVMNFTRQLLKGGEHTWGTDTQYGETTLPNNIWTNAGLEHARRNRSAAAGDIGVGSSCPGLHGNHRPEPPCPKYWWASDLKTCQQGCPSSAQVRDPRSGRCRCGDGEESRSLNNTATCLAGLQCVQQECVECALRPQPVNPFPLIESMWREQREWALDHAISALDGHPLQDIIRSEIAQLRPTLPDLGGGYERLSPSDAIGRRWTCGGLNLSFGATGAITHLQLPSGRTWASEGARLLELRYQTLSFPDFAEFYSEYFYDVGGAAKCTPASSGYPCGSYGKPGLNTNGTGPTSQLVPPRMTALYHRSLPQAGGDPNPAGAGGCVFQVDLAFPKELVAEYGAPARAVMEVKIAAATATAAGATLAPTLRIFNKTSTRRPEAMWLSNQPPADPRVAPPQILMNKLGASCAGCNPGSWIDAASVVHNGSQRVHAVSDLGVQIRRPGGGTATFVSRDSALVRVGADELTPLPTPSSPPNTSAGFAFNLWNNAWGTNYVMWYPFDKSRPADRDLLFRLELNLEEQAI